MIQLRINKGSSNNNGLKIELPTLKDTKINNLRDEVNCIKGNN